MDAARAIAIAEANLGDGHTRTEELRHGMAKQSVSLGAYDEVQGYLNLTLVGSLDSYYLRSAHVLLTFALFDMQRNDRVGAILRPRQFRAILDKRAVRAVSSPSLDAAAVLRKAEKTLVNYWFLEAPIRSRCPM